MLTSLVEPLNNGVNKKNLLSFDLRKFADNHAIWNNTLLVKSANGELSLEDYKTLFSQYYFYSKSFLRILSTMMIKCEIPEYNIQLVDNFWEETGKNDQAQSHARLFKNFLSNGLGIKFLDSIRQKNYTENFVNEYMSLCLNSNALECAAVLSFATEGIVSRLYKIFKVGLLKSGIKEEDLIFFTVHIGCDDAHAAVLESIFIHYHRLENKEHCSTNAVKKALDLRDKFFSNIYSDIKNDTNLE